VSQALFDGTRQFNWQPTEHYGPEGSDDWSEWDAQDFKSAQAFMQLADQEIAWASPAKCGFSLEEQTDLTERSWVNLVICMAGNQADLSNGHHDTGAQSDLAQALVAAAGVISTGRRPRAHVGELTSDALLASARDLASSLLAQHRTLVERVTQELLDRPDSTWENPDLDSLTRDQAP